VVDYLAFFKASSKTTEEGKSIVIYVISEMFGQTLMLIHS